MLCNIYIKRVINIFQQNKWLLRLLIDFNWKLDLSYVERILFFPN